MTTDKRNIATDALEVLGTVITDKEVGRDAIHLACLPVTTSDEWTLPGAHVGINPDNGVSVVSLSPRVGIIDPFLPKPVPKGTKVLLVIYPRTIESLRHVWSHPDIPDEAVGGPPAAKSEPSKPQTMEELRAALDTLGRILDPPVAGRTLIDAMDDDGYITVYGYDAHGHIPIPDDLWAAYETINGRKAERDPRGSTDDNWNVGVHFSCSC